MGRNRNARTWLFSLCWSLALAATFFAYWPGLHGPFVFDDISSIIQARDLRITRLDFDSLYAAAFWQKSTSLGRPLAMLSFALNYYFTQFDVFYFKFTNLLIHVGNGVLLYWLSLKILGCWQRESKDPAFTSEHQRWLALAVTALWLLHPLNLTSVLYVVQRMTSLSASFVLLGLILYVRGREQLLQDKMRGFATMAISLLLFGLLATFTKENGVLLPLYMLVLEVWIFRFQASVRFRKPLLTAWGIMIAIPLILSLIILMVKPNLLLGLFSYQYRDFTLGERLLTETRALWFYLRLILIPDIRAMGIFHDDFPVSSGLFDPPITSLAVMGILALAAAAMISYKKARIISFAIAWFFVGHSMESTFLPLELVHEHRNYLPQFGILLALAYYLLHSAPSLRRSLIIRRGTVGIYLTLLCAVTTARAYDWKDEWTLYNRDVINHPGSARAHTMLAIILHDNKQYAVAESEFKTAAILEPANSGTIIRLAQHYYSAHRAIPENILVELEQRLRIHPYSGITIADFSALLNNTLDNHVLNLRLIRMLEQLISRKDVVVSQGWYEFAYRTLAFTYRERKEFVNALKYFDKAIELAPYPAYYLSKGEIYMKMGQPGEATRMLGLVDASDLVMNGDDLTRKNNLLNAIKSAQDKPKHRPQRITN